MENKNIIMFFFILSISLFGCSGSSTSNTSSGSLDSNFGVDGKVTTAVGSMFDSIRDVVIQADGSIVAVGSSPTGTYTSLFAIARYKSDGSLDTSFNSTGKVTTAVGSISDIASTAIIQADGKIVVVGGSASQPGNDIFALARYNTNGTLDTSFGTGGTVTTTIGNASFANSVAIQRDGKIVVAGSAFISATSEFALARYNTDGSLDTGFGNSGIVTTSTGTSSVALYVCVQTNDKIFAVGKSSFGASTSALILIRYNSDGSLDTTFGNNGMVTTPTVDIGINNVAMQTNGKIVAAGYSAPGGFGLARSNPDGTLDTSFGSGGIVVTNGTNGIAWDVAIQNDGKIVAAGFSFIGSTPVFALARYNTNGSLDEGFNSTGIVTTAIGSINDSVNAIAIGANGRILAAGSSRTGSNTGVFALAQYLP
jgi:uncharacterized delta-60 repeat protein